MKNTQLLLLLIITTLSIGCITKSKETNTTPLTGLWTLYAMEQQDSTTGVYSEWNNGMQGYLLYDGTNHMGLHLTTKGYEKTDLRFPNFNDTISLDALKHLTNSYLYFAKYVVNEKEGIVEHARISHSNPSDWNKIVKRRYSFSGDTLILQPVEKSNAGLRLKWLKDSN